MNRPRKISTDFDTLPLIKGIAMIRYADYLMVLGISGDQGMGGGLNSPVIYTRLSKHFSSQIKSKVVYMLITPFNSAIRVPSRLQATGLLRDAPVLGCLDLPTG